MLQIGSMRLHSTGEVAALCKVNRITLQRWVTGGKVKAPPVQHGIRLWTGRDVERVRKYRAKHYAEGRGRKPKRKR